LDDWVGSYSQVDLAAVGRPRLGKRRRARSGEIIIGCDFHARYQQIAMANDETRELLLDRRVDYQSGDTAGSYEQLKSLGNHHRL